MISQTHDLKFDAKHGVICARLDSHLYSNIDVFNELWQIHPPERPSIFLHGRQVKLPRWQQAYGRSYFFSGQSSEAISIPDILKPYLIWAQTHIDTQLNGMLLNWYEGADGHYIGAHRDSTKGLVKDSSIVMISLGGSRVMRFRSVNRSGYIDLDIHDGDVVIMPLTTNNLYKHEIPKFKRHQDKRISITLRSFE